VADNEIEKQKDALRRFFMDRKTKPQDIEDLTQQVFERVLAALHRGEIIKDMRSYCLRAANNLLISRYRHDSASVVSLGLERLETLPSMPLEVWFNEPQQRWTAFQRLKELAQRVSDALGKQYCDVLFLDRGAGCTDEEISKETGLSVHTVRKLKTEARSFCEMLKKEEQQK
jgi:RNA polymerase sigma factor (sigma-70 family)